jgi:hypothetical protein
MKKIFFACMFAAVLLTSCGGDSAVKVNETIVAGVDGSVTLLEKAGTYIGADQYDEAKAYLDSTSIHVTAAIEAIEKLENKSAVEFKQAALDLLRQISTEGIPAYKQAIDIYLTDSEDQDDYNRANALINDFIDKVQKSQTAVQQIQVAFAAKNNVQLR